ncbi:MAG: sugar ABC transporter substrate-binding protein [Selenomonadaceae bacterium]|nr:sugar ABC transporter substrate-binding protein [Selenomonadaceae bacterium]
MLLTITLTSGCGSSGGGSGGSIAYLNFDNSDVFVNIIKTEFEKGASSKGLNVEYFDAKGDINLQIDQMKEVLAGDYKVIVLIAADGKLIVPMVEQANAEGMTVITINRAIAGGEHVEVFSDEAEAGKMQADYLAKTLPQGANIVYLEGEGNQTNVIQRWEGFSKGIASKRPDVKILDMQSAAWSKVEAMKITVQWLSLFPKIDAVVCGNDQMALGAISALKAANRLQGCQVTGVDAVDEALKAVAAGEMVQTIKQDAAKQGSGAVGLAEEALKGQKPSNVNVPFVSITRENLSQFMK